MPSNATQALPMTPIRIGTIGFKLWKEPNIPETLAATIAGALKDQNFIVSCLASVLLAKAQISSCWMYCSISTGISRGAPSGGSSAAPALGPSMAAGADAAADAACADAAAAACADAAADAACPIHDLLWFLNWEQVRVAIVIQHRASIACFISHSFGMNQKCGHS